MHVASEAFSAKLAGEWQRKQESFQAWERRMEEEARRKKRERAVQQAAAQGRFAGNRLARSHRLGRARQAADERINARPAGLGACRRWAELPPLNKTADGRGGRRRCVRGEARRPPGRMVGADRAAARGALHGV